MHPRHTAIVAKWSKKNKITKFGARNLDIISGILNMFHRISREEKVYKSKEIKSFVSTNPLKEEYTQKMSFSFHPNLIANLYDFPSSAEHMKKDMKQIVTIL